MPTPRSLLRRAALTGLPPLRRLVAERDRLRRRVNYLNLRTQSLSRENLRYAAALDDGLRAVGGAIGGGGSVAAGDAAGDGVAGDNADLGFLFVVSYGRSGTTVLQGLLNTIPGYLIRGENRAALHSLAAFHRALVTEKHTQIQVAQEGRGLPIMPDSAWYGIDMYAEDVAVDLLRHTVVSTLLRPTPDTRVVGFKEIRWWQDDWEGYWDFLEALFPGLRVIINTRNRDDVASSSWWTEHEDPLGMLARYEERLGRIEERLGDRAYRMHYDEWVADPEVLRGMYAWLGEEYDPAVVEAVLAVKHSH